jgi:hypothetical protein
MSRHGLCDRCELDEEGTLHIAPEQCIEGLKKSSKEMESAALTWKKAYEDEAAAAKKMRMEKDQIIQSLRDELDSVERKYGVRLR